jgi:hypothetical protein
MAQMPTSSSSPHPRQNTNMNKEASALVLSVFEGDQGVDSAAAAADADGNPRKARRASYNGVDMPESDAAVLAHVLDSFLDHLGRRDLPNLTFAVGPFRSLGSTNKYKAKDDGPGTKFTAPVTCAYPGVVVLAKAGGAGNGRRRAAASASASAVMSDYFAIDNIWFEMCPILTADGSRAHNHMVTWMNVYLSEPGARQLVDKFESDTGGWRLKPSQFRWHDDDDEGEQQEGGGGSAASVTVSMSDEEPPTWVEMALPKSGRSGTGGGADTDTGMDLGGTDLPAVQLQRMGPVRDVMSDPAKHGVYRGTGIFCATYNVVSNSRGATANTLASKRDEAAAKGSGGTAAATTSTSHLPPPPLLQGRLALQLVGTRIVGRDDQFRRPAFAKRKKRGYSSI